MYDAMSNRAGVCYDPYTPSQRRELREQVVAFFDAEESAPDSISPLSIISVRHVREILLQCRELYVEARSAAASVGRSGGLEGTTVRVGRRGEDGKGAEMRERRRGDSETTSETVVSPHDSPITYHVITYHMRYPYAQATHD